MVWLLTARTICLSGNRIGNNRPWLAAFLRLLRAGYEPPLPPESLQLWLSSQKLGGSSTSQPAVSSRPGKTCLLAALLSPVQALNKSFSVRSAPPWASRRLTYPTCWLIRCSNFTTQAACSLPLTATGGAHPTPQPSAPAVSPRPTALNRPFLPP